MTVHIEFLVEELSAERFLRIVVPTLIPDVSFDVRSFNGKHDLLRKLPQRLAGYAGWVGGAATRVVVLVDRDTDDCHALKKQLESMAHSVGLSTPSTVRDGSIVQVLNRIAIEELEAWFFGDVPALRACYPRVPESLAQQVKYRDPDAVPGGTAEVLERLLQAHGYHAGGLPKVGNAEALAPVMDLDNNRSVSFRAFRDGVRSLASREEA